MKWFIENLKLKNELKLILLFHYIHFLLILTATLFGWTKDFGLISSISFLIFILLFYRLYTKTLINLLYSYWTFTFILACILFYRMYESSFIYSDFFSLKLYIAATLVLGLESFLISSPIFFPRITWWEYDFRYKGDLKVIAMLNQEKYQGRLTDLRRGAGCVVLFENIDIGEKIIVSLANGHQIHGEIMTKREPVLGRGITYGLKIIFYNSEDKKHFLYFSKQWRLDRKNRRKVNFSRNFQKKST